MFGEVSEYWIYFKIGLCLGIRVVNSTQPILQSKILGIRVNEWFFFYLRLNCL